jgi:hypothetical protein
MRTEEKPQMVKMNFKLQPQKVLELEELFQESSTRMSLHGHNFFWRAFHSLEETWGYATILFTTTCNYASFVTRLQLMCNYYILHPLMQMLLGLYLSMNKLQWPISYMCNQNLVANWCTMYIMGMISIHIWGCIIKKFTYIIINIYYECDQHICRGLM